MIPVSLLSSYLYCPRRIFLERVLEIKAPPAPPTFKGTVKHRVYDLVNKNEQGIVTQIKSFISFNDVFSLYRKNYYRVLSNTILELKPKLKELEIDPMQLFHSSWQIFLKEAKSRALNVFRFIKTNKILGQELWEKLTPKYLTELSVKSESLNLIGIIDKVEINKDNYTPIELKSGMPPKTGVWPGNKIQLTAYILMLKEKFGNSSQGCIYYIDSDIKREVVINPFSQQEVTKVRDNILELFKSKVPPKICENKNKCTNCALKEQCYNLVQP